MPTVGDLTLRLDVDLGRAAEGLKTFVRLVQFSAEQIQGLLSFKIQTPDFSKFEAELQRHTAAATTAAGAEQELAKSAGEAGAAQGGLHTGLINAAAGMAMITQGAMIARQVMDKLSEPIRLNMDLEQALTSWEVMLGSMDAAKKRMEEIEHFAAVTPFSTAEVDALARGLQAVGRYSEDTMRTLGDLAAASGKPIAQAMMAYQKMASGQKGIAVDMFRDLLISTKDWEAATGKAFSTAGMFLGTADEMIAALPKIIASKNFAGMMDKQSATVAGKVSTLKDNVSFILRDAGKIAFEAFGGMVDLANVLLPILKDITPALLGIVAGTVAWLAVTHAGAAFAAIEHAILGIRIALLDLNAAMLLNPFTIMAVAVAGLVTGLSLLKKTQDEEIEQYKKAAHEAAQYANQLNKCADGSTELERALKFMTSEEISQALIKARQELYNFNLQLVQVNAMQAMLEDKAGVFGINKLFRNLISGTDTEVQKSKDKLQEMINAINEKTKLLLEGLKAAEARSTDVSKVGFVIAMRNLITKLEEEQKALPPAMRARAHAITVEIARINKEIEDFLGKESAEKLTGFVPITQALIAKLEAEQQKLGPEMRERSLAITAEIAQYNKDIDNFIGKEAKESEKKIKGWGFERQVSDWAQLGEEGVARLGLAGGQVSRWAQLFGKGVSNLELPKAFKLPGLLGIPTLEQATALADYLKDVEAQARVELDRMEEMLKSYGRMFGDAIIGGFKQEGAVGALKGTLKSIAVVLMDFLEKELPLWILGITGTELATKGLLGFGTAGAAIAVLIGLMEAAKATIGSMALGGEFTEPTLLGGVLVGDAGAAANGRNVEWIVNSRHIERLLTESREQVRSEIDISALQREMRMLRNEFKKKNMSMNVSGTLSGQRFFDDTMPEWERRMQRRKI